MDGLKVVEISQVAPIVLGEPSGKRQLPGKSDGRSSSPGPRCLRSGLGVPPVRLRKVSLLDIYGKSGSPRCLTATPRASAPSIEH